MLQDYLIELAAFPGDAPDPDCLINFYLDQVRTHSLVRFTSVSAASRVRTALHGIVWPNERNRKELWADFIPDDKVVEWVGREQSEGVRGSSSRWEVQYEPDDNGAMTAKLVNAETEPVRRNSTRQPLGPPPVPTGPARSSFPVVEGAPLGPRGRGGNRYSQAHPLAPQHQQQGQQSGGGERDDRGWKTTQARPSVSYKPVPAELTQRRLANLKSYITKDRHRNLGAPNEINRYTFEDGDEFVDRGKEAFIGIRPPHRERERRRLGIGRGGNRGSGRAPSPHRPRDEGFYQPSRDDFGRDRGFDRGFERRDDRGFGGRRDDVPRSRFDGQPLPTFSGPGPRGPRRGGGGGGRRDRY
jgi:SAP domain-containing ribonucleoprotein